MVYSQVDRLVNWSVLLPLFFKELHSGGDLRTPLRTRAHRCETEGEKEGRGRAENGSDTGEETSFGWKSFV